MKDRILAYLDDFSQGKSTELSAELKKELNLDDATFTRHAQEVRAAILHNYAQFSISTIDAFFQRVIRSFTREAGLVGDYRLEVDQDMVMEEVIGNLIDELGANKELTRWVVEFANENLENERAWDVRALLIEFTKEIFREEYKALEDEIAEETKGENFFRELNARLWQSKNFFLNRVNKPAATAIQIINNQPWDITDIYYGKGSGLVTFFRDFAVAKDVKGLAIGKRVRENFTIASNWPSKTTRHAAEIKRVAEQELVPILAQIMNDYDAYYSQALSAEVALRNLYAFGLLTDIARKLKEYKAENNLMLLADAPKFLNGVIQDSDTPFIYEKVGSFYRHYLIDEFQDTSGLQWKNFLPLLTNSLDQGYSCMVVGDVKQAIYRWRSGDLKLLQQTVEEHIGAARTEKRELNSNFRSASSVVDFNNEVFRTASSLVSADTGGLITGEVYHDVFQKTSKEGEGFVHVQFIKDEGEKDWKEIALDQVPRYLEQLQDLGVRLNEIGILVRRNSEGQRLVAHLLNYKDSDRARKDCKYDVVSNESLRLDSASAVNLLLSALKYLLNTDDALACAQLAYEFAKLHEPERKLSEVFAVDNRMFFERRLPADFAEKKTSLKKLPLFELTETLIQLFGLGKVYGELAYLQAFQDLILEFSSRERSDLEAFLAWWELNKDKKSIQVSGEADAAQLLTIHKSKGLQFKYVIIPMCSWNLDHDMSKPVNLWVKSEQPPFDKAGYLPVKYSGTLKETWFNEDYEAERTRIYLDNLNLLYVALTRAEQGLIVLAPHMSVTGTKNTVSGLLQNAINQSIKLQEHWDEGAQLWKLGSWAKATEVRSHEPLDAVSLRDYSTHSWREKLVIRQTAKNYFNADERDALEKARTGTHLHAVLSRIRFADESEQALEESIREGLITTEEKKEVGTRLAKLFANPQIADWFSHDWDVRTEIPILVPGNMDNRIDRLLLKGKQAIVIDFKTGEPRKDDQVQVAWYIDILKLMGFEKVEGFLLYTRTNDVVNVPVEKSNKVKQKDKKQLGLDF